MAAAAIRAAAATRTAGWNGNDGGCGYQGCGGYQDGGYDGGWNGNDGGCGYQGCDGYGNQGQWDGYQGQWYRATAIRARTPTTAAAIYGCGYGDDGTYVVQRGDTLAKIAARFGTTLVPAVRTQRALESQLDLRRAGPPNSLATPLDCNWQGHPASPRGGMSLPVKWGKSLLARDDDPHDHVRHQARNPARHQGNQERQPKPKQR